VLPGTVVRSPRPGKRGHDTDERREEGQLVHVSSDVSESWSVLGVGVCGGSDGVGSSQQV